MAPSRARVVATAIGALAAVFLGGSANAAPIDKLTIETGSLVTVNKPGFNESRQYLLAGISEFSVVEGEKVGDVQALTIVDFEIPATPIISQQNHSFTIESASGSGVYVDKVDLDLLWDMSTGSVTSETFRVELSSNFFGQSQQVSYFDLQLITGTIPSFTCNLSDQQPQLDGSPLPPGALPEEGGALTLVAAGCAIDVVDGAPANQLPNTIPSLIINGTLTAPEPSTGLLLTSGLAMLGFLGRGRRA